MKSIFLIISILASTSIFSQELTKELYISFKNDNKTELATLISDTDIDACYTNSKASYGLLSLSIKMNSTSCFNYLLEKGIDVETNCTGKSPLLYAVKYGRLEMLKKLIEKGANSNISNRGRTPIDYAIKYDQKEIVKYLSSIE